MREYTVTIPVHNGFEHLAACFASVHKNTPADVDVLVCNDGSTEDGVSSMIEIFCSRRKQTGSCGFRKAVGFVEMVNKAFENTTEDVVILNSDTVVPPHWLERLDAARDSMPRVAAVCPVSNHATIYSVPRMNDNPMAPADTDERDRLVRDCSASLVDSLPIPTVHGFCMLLTREALDEVGRFDTVFSPGYGEEVDWCQRARALGYQCILASSVFVYHKGQGSFCDRRNELAARAEGIIRERYPEYEREVQEWVRVDPLRELKTSLEYALHGPSTELPMFREKLRVFHVQHSYDSAAGIENLTRWLVGQNQTTLEQSVVYPQVGLTEQAQTRFEDGVMVTGISRSILDYDLSVRGIPEVSRVDRALLGAFNSVIGVRLPDVVQFNHLAFWNVDAFNLACDVSRVVVTLHDDFLLCPRLLDRQCGKTLAEGPDCANCCMPEVTARGYLGHAHLVRNLRDRLSVVRGILDRADAVVSPSEALRQKFIDGVGPVAEKIRVIRNGVPRWPYIRNYSVNDGFARVAVVGNLTEHKGFRAFAHVMRQLPAIRWHVFGAVDPSLDLCGLEHVQFHGAYTAADLPQMLQGVDLALPTVAHNEAYGLVADECLAALCPVLLPDLPVLRERYARFDVSYKWGDSESLKGALETWEGNFYDDPQWFVQRRNDGMSGVRTIEECAADYLALYREVLG